MNLFYALINFYFAFDNIVRYSKDKRIFNLIVGLLFAMTSGIYCYLFVLGEESESAPNDAAEA